MANLPEEITPVLQAIKGLMLDIPSQYMQYCVVLLCEVYCVIVEGLGPIDVFFVRYLGTCY